MSFQTHANYNWPTGYEGDFASANPHKTVVSTSLGFRAGKEGVTVGRFAWADAEGILANAGTTRPAGFVYRNQQAYIPTIPGSYTNAINAGFPVTLAEGGDFFARSSTVATTGQSVFASTKDGTISTGDRGSAPTDTVETGWTVARGGDAGELIIINGLNHTPAALAAPAPKS